MNWAITLAITDCASKAPLGGAMITDGVSTYYADGNGRFVAVVSGYYSQYVVAVSYSGYYSTNVVLSQSQAGQTLSVCLNKVPPPPPNGGGGKTNGGW